MIKRITLLLLTSLIWTTGFSQILVGANAHQLFPGAERVRLDENTQLPRHIQFKLEAQPNINGALDYLSKNTVLGRETTFQSISSSTDHLGITHHKYQQLVNGKPVIGGVYILHTRNGKVESMNGQISKIQNNTDQASLSKASALSIGLSPFPNATYGWEMSHGGGIRQTLSEYPDPELVWVQEGFNFKSRDFRLAYKMDIYAVDHGHHHRSWVYVDAQSGEIIAEENRICEMDVPSSARTVYSDTQTILTEQVAADTFLLRQSTYGNGIITLDMNNQTNTEQAVDFVHEDTDWGLEFGFADRHALDAHYASEQFYLMLDSLFDRTVLQEGNDSLPLLCYVHYDNNLANAFWNGSASFYGDGDNSPGSTLDNPLTTVDVVAHEFTHGLTQFTAGLIYTYEPGALNESFSDIFGIATDFYARPDIANWLIGEDATSNGRGIRDAETPGEFNHPDTYFGDNWRYGNGDSGGVHSNSGVQNHWYYLLSVGGTGINDNGDPFEVEGIGWEKALAVAYRNLSTYLTPSSDHQDAAYYAGISALELFGACSQEYESTVNAWHAVGVGEPIGEEVVVDFLSQRIFCEAPVEIAFINNSNNYESVEWDFGDGNMSTDFSPVHNYMMPGSYDVTLTLTMCDGSTETVLKDSYIIIDNNHPVCSALTLENIDTILINDCTGTILDPGGLSFYDTLANSLVIIDPPMNDPLLITFNEFELGFGDFVRVYDGPSTTAPLLAQYQGPIGLGQTIETTAGVAAIHFTSNDNLDSLSGFSFTYTPASAVVNPPVAAFTVASTDVSLNAPVQFIDNSTTPGLYFWDFGDGNTSEEAEPVHQYTEPGTYTVTQRIVNCIGEDETTVEITVIAGGIAFINPDSICITLNAGEILDMSFDFINQGNANLYYNFPDSPQPWFTMSGQEGELQPNESLTIDVSFDARNLVANTYFFIFQVETGDLNQLNIGFPVKMIVLPFPQTGFEVEAEDFCNGTYLFNDQTLNTPTTWLWDFGDGNTSTESSPIYQYEEEGVYEVSLVACNDLGCDSLTQDELILVNYCDTLVFEETGSSLLTNCNGLLFDQGGPDGIYANNSDYIVTINPEGVDFISLTFNFFQIQPVVDYLLIYDGADTLAPVLANYTGSLSNQFVLNSTGGAVTLRFVTNSVGAFNGFEIAWSCNSANPPMDAAFSLEQQGNCDNTVSLSATPIGNFNYTWDLGDGNIIITETPNLEYHYQTAGTYNIGLEITNVLGSSIANGATATVSDIPFTLEAEISDDVVNAGTAVSLEAIVDITPASYLWIPQEGDTLTNAMENYTYDSPGDYIIYLEVTDNDGCKMSVRESIEVIDPLNATDFEIIENFEIIPNPSNGAFTISLDLTDRKNANLLMFNPIGQMIHQEGFGQVQNIRKELNFNQLPSGIYFVTIVTDKGTVGVRRLVVQK